MGFLHNLFKRYPKREEWGDISQCIAVGFENARRGWFVDFCVILRDAQMELAPELPSDVELLLKAFQLGSVSGFAGDHNYLPVSESQNFCDLFWGRRLVERSSRKSATLCKSFLRWHPKRVNFIWPVV